MIFIVARRTHSMEYMMPPVRCYTCGKPVCAQIEKCIALRGEGVELSDALLQTGFTLERTCCRRVAMSCFVIEPQPRDPKEILGYCEFLTRETQSHRIVPSR